MRGSCHLVVNLLASPLCAYAAVTFLPAATAHPLVASTTVIIGTILSCKLPDQIEVIKLLGHRTWSHSIIPIAAIVGLLLFTPTSPWFLQIALLSIINGYAIHLLADTFSMTGIPWLAIGPRLRLPLYTTGKTSELLILVLIGAGLITANLLLVPLFHTWLLQLLQLRSGS